jgi:hypothetical protein
VGGKTQKHCVVRWHSAAGTKALCGVTISS